MLVVRELTATLDADDVRADIISWFDDGFRCDPHATYPDEESLRRAISGDEGVLVVYDDNTVVGLGVYRPDSDRVLWMLAPRDRYVDVSAQILHAVKQRTGRTPWGAIGNEEMRGLLIAANVVESDPDHAQYGEAAVRYTEA